MTTDFRTSTAEGKVNFVNVYDLEKAASLVIPTGAFGYISSGAGDMWTLEQNTKSFNHKVIAPGVLRNIENPDQSTTILGQKISTPIIMAPVAAHALANVQGEAATCKGVAESDTIYTVSSYAGQTYEGMRAASGDAPQWFQFYMSKNDDDNIKILDLAVKNGAKAIVLTADATVGGNREIDLRNGFTFPIAMPIVASYQSGVGQTMDAVYKSSRQNLSYKDIEFIQKHTNLPVFVKGVQTAEDAEAVIEAGADGIWVSNHGGRQLDGGRASFDSLEEVAEAVNKRVPIVFDSGIRRAQHVFKALASGADVVAIGRPVIYGLALGGSEGVKEVFDYFKNELKMVMQLAGTHNIEEIKNTKLRKNEYM
ncbi:alpha-hydroxy-acid oxidizing protein [Floricoccus penangensis]|uniref:alpha-hydroxy-acid oxidizing protein n=1 Tax=Floricoccus penangensis TaxID=1859475 RepID=UPI00203C4212|nr:alpha-hydroxy-acid oxidizing protein [Floricoccus penangensis]URZ86544.1 alpha-hydroxy-acid oxidizing protein [Floricoccus penangensis]